MSGVLLALVLCALIGLALAPSNVDDKEFQYYRSKQHYNPYKSEITAAASDEILASGIQAGPATFDKTTFATVQEEVYCYLRKIGYNDKSTAAIMGNIDAESNFVPGTVEQTNDPRPKGYGLFQLTNERNSPNAGRSTDMRKFVSKSGAKYPSVESQLEFFEWETKNTAANALSLFYQSNYRRYYKPINSPLYDKFEDTNLTTWEQFKTYTGSTDILTAAFMMGFERPAFSDKINHLTTRRIPKARLYEQKFDDSTCSVGRLTSMTGANGIKASNLFDPSNITKISGLSAAEFKSKAERYMLGHTDWSIARKNHFKTIVVDHAEAWLQSEHDSAMPMNIGFVIGLAVKEGGFDTVKHTSRCNLWSMGMTNLNPNGGENFGPCTDQSIPRAVKTLAKKYIHNGLYSSCHFNLAFPCMNGTYCCGKCGDSQCRTCAQPCKGWTETISNEASRLLNS